MGQLMIALVLLALGGQTDSAGSNDLITVSGCLRGTHLKLPSETSAVEASMRASEYLLEGSKETLRTMRKDHDGHYLEVTGTLKVPKDGKIYQKQLGPKTRITVGTRESEGTAGTLEATPVSLIVSSYRDLADQCHER